MSDDVVAKMREGLKGLLSNFECIAALPASEQAHYPNGVRPFGTGDLRYAIETLKTALAAAPAPDAGGVGETVGQELARLIEEVAATPSPDADHAGELKGLRWALALWNRSDTTDHFTSELEACIASLSNPAAGDG